MRIAQEMVLGIGGWRLLETLKLKPEVCHLNEGHAAFAVLERARRIMHQNGMPFEAALTISRAGNLFTTHTPVEAGFDRFAPDLVSRFLGNYAEEQLRINIPQLLALGRYRPGDRTEPFNMAYLAIRGSGAINAVSALHGAVSRRIFAPLFPRWPEAEVPISHVTNGVHTATWDSAASDDLWTEACGKDRWLGEMENVGADIRRVSDEQLWQLRSRNRLEFVPFVRERFAAELTRRGEDAEVARTIFDPATLTLAFARRFATYKRANLLLHDPERLVRMLTNQERPVQLVIAGKAHPQDEAGQAMIKAWVEFVRRPEVRRRVVFLSDYDLLLAERLVQGADVWINNPRRPWQACGTSGMKVLVNGGLNLSELDGWWAEAYSPEVGWAVGDGKEHGDDPALDAAEAEELYDTLEKKVIPAFYIRDWNDLPKEWVARIRESIARLAPLFSANRAVREYTEKYYLPAAAQYRQRVANRGSQGAALLRSKQALTQHWPSVRFGELHVDSSDGKHSMRVEVKLADLHPDRVRVQLYADSVNGQSPFIADMISNGADPNHGWTIYTADVPASCPVSEYTARIVPSNPEMRVALEDPHILWFDKTSL